MYKLVLIIVITFYCYKTNGQVGIGTTSPHNSAILDVSGSNKGLLVPRVSLTGTNDVSTITSPETSLLIYNTSTTTGTNAVNPGFYYYNGSVWVSIVNQPPVYYDSNNNLISALSGDSLLTGNGDRNVALGQGALSNTGSAQVIRSIAIGSYAGETDTGDNNISIGEDALRNPRGSGRRSIAIGTAAARYDSTTNISGLIAIGDYAGQYNEGPNSTLIGYNSGRYNKGNYVNTIGFHSGGNNTVAFVNTIGYFAGFNNTGHSSNLIGSSAGRENTANSINAIGYESAYNNTGVYLNAIGFYAGRNNKGQNNNAFGYGALRHQQEAGNYINAIGYEACRDDSTNGNAYINAIGYRAGLSNKAAYLNGLGYYAGGYNTGSYLNTIGYFSGQNNTGTQVNTIGSFTGRNNTGHYLTAIGYQAGHQNKGDHNIALGYRAMAAPDDVGHNIAIGYGAAEYDSSGVSISAYNNSLGYYSGRNNKGQTINAIGRESAANNTGHRINAMGYFAAFSNEGDYVNAFGYNAGRNNQGDYNTFIGTNLIQTITGNNNLLIGNNVTVIDPAESNQVNINNQIIADKDGNIGLGIAVPTEALDIDGNVKISGLSGSFNENVYTDSNGTLKKGGAVNLAYSSTAPGGQIPVGYNAYRDVDGFYHSTITLPSSGSFVGEIFTFNHLATFNTTISTTNTNMSSSLLVTSSMGGAAFVWSGSRWMLIT